MALNSLQEIYPHLKKNYFQILQYMQSNNYVFPSLPSNLHYLSENGEVYSKAYSIQGILKYHGFYDTEKRIPFFSSISFNNSSIYSISYLKFDNSLDSDKVILNGNNINGPQFSRVKQSLVNIRRLAGLKSKAILISRNIVNTEKQVKIGKGLGTSASGSSALGIAAAAIIYKSNPEYVKNSRLVSIFSRYLSGSGARSAVGGFGLWLSYPGIDPLNCYALRLDTDIEQDFIKNLAIITINIPSIIETQEAQKLAPESIFYPSWLLTRKKLIIDFIDALHDLNLTKIGELGEYDTLCLHAISMTPGLNKKILAWKPKTLEIMNLIYDLRKVGFNVYYTIDTGPSVVLLTFENEKNRIIKELTKIISSDSIIVGNIAGPASILSPESKEAKKLEEDINKFYI